MKSLACVFLFKVLFAGFAVQLQKTIDHRRILGIDIVAIQKQQVLMFDVLCKCCKYKRNMCCVLEQQNKLTFSVFF